MVKTNFSATEMEICELTSDLARGDFALHVDGEKLTKKDLEDYARERIQKEILGGLTLFQAFRRNKTVLFEIVEEIVNITLSNDIMNVPFMDNFVEFKNRHLGDKTVWVTEGDSYFSVVKFAGNHWDTNREQMDTGSEFTLPKEWVYIHCYDEFERFLLGIASLERLADTIQRSFNKYIKERCYLQFQNIMDVVPTEFEAGGNSEEAVGNLCDLVQAAGGYGSLTIAGTRAALRKLAGIIPDKYFADSQKEAKSSTGTIAEWEGNKLMVIPQVLKQGTFELALDDDVLFIMGGDVKPIKLEFIGDTRTQDVTDNRVNNDMSYDLQVQTCFGIGLMLPKCFGKFNFA